MYTTIKCETGETFNHVTQQYEIGTYFIVNSNPRYQGYYPGKERDYHIKVRKKAVEHGNDIIAGNYIHYKGKTNINPFIKE
jgi:hypothetical protein